MRKYFILILISITTFLLFNYGWSHVQHYKKIKYLKYGLFLNDKLIGNHVFEIKTEGKIIKVIGNGSFKVDKLGVVLMNYRSSSEEIYKNGQLIKYVSKTSQNDKKKFTNIVLNNKNKLQIDGSSFKGETEKKFLVGNWWNHEIVKSSKQISPISGRVINQKVRFLGKKFISINKTEYEALHFHFLSDDDKPLNKKKLNIQVWYDAKTLLWLKASYEKFGTWEYRLEEVK
tara:strand:- start:435 stop:1124 length:690 start_codon:yes stop_codon:yes gene_type:complete